MLVTQIKKIMNTGPEKTRIEVLDSVGFGLFYNGAEHYLH